VKQFENILREIQYADLKNQLIQKSQINISSPFLQTVQFKEAPALRMYVKDLHHT